METNKFGPFDFARWKAGESVFTAAGNLARVTHFEERNCSSYEYKCMLLMFPDGFFRWTNKRGYVGLSQYLFMAPVLKTFYIDPDMEKVKLTPFGKGIPVSFELTKNGYMFVGSAAPFQQTTPMAQEQPAQEPAPERIICYLNLYPRNVYNGRVGSPYSTKKEALDARAGSTEGPVKVTIEKQNGTWVCIGSGDPE